MRLASTNNQYFAYLYRFMLYTFGRLGNWVAVLLVAVLFVMRWNAAALYDFVIVK